MTLIGRKHCRRPAQHGYCKYLIYLVRPSRVGRFSFSKRWTVCHDARIAHILTVVTIIARRDLMGTVAVEEPLKIQSILWQAISSVADDIGPSSIARGVRSKEQVCALQLVRFTLSTHGDLVSPDVLGFWRDEVGYFGSHVARGDGIGPSELYPFHSQRLDEVDDASLGSVVSCLQLGYIDDVGTHAGGSNEASISKALEGFPVACGAFVLLPPPMLASILGAIECAVQICGDDLAVMPIIAI